VMTNKYAEGYPHKRYYGGCEFVDVAEDVAIERVFARSKNPRKPARDAVARGNLAGWDFVGRNFADSVENFSPTDFG